MPRKVLAARPTRAEQMPEFWDVSRSRREDTVPIDARDANGSLIWKVDQPITRMHERGLFRVLAEAGMSAKPHKIVRRQLMDAAMNAFNEVENRYSWRRDKLAIEGQQKTLADAERALKSLIPVLENSLHRELVGDAKALILAVAELQSPPQIANSERLGATTDFFHEAFVRAMLNFWRSETGEATPQYPNKGLLIDLAVATWSDARFPDFASDKLPGRVTKWFYNFGKLSRSQKG